MRGIRILGGVDVKVATGQGLAGYQGYMRECLYWYQGRVLVAVVFEVDACIEA